MSGPPRMLLLDASPSGGGEALVVLPISYDKAIQAAMEKFSINKDQLIVRLGCRTSDMLYVASYTNMEEVYMNSTDNDSFHYACAGKHIVRLIVHVFDKDGKGGVATVAGSGEKIDVAAAGGGEKKDVGASAAKKDAGGSGGKTADISIDVKNSAGKNVTLTGSITGDLAKGPSAGSYLGALTVAPNSLNHTFVGQQLGSNEVLSKYVIHDKSTARLIFQPRSVRPNIDILPPEEKSVEVSLSLLDWQVLAAYPVTSLFPDNGRQKVRWFLRVRPGGVIEDLMTGTEASGLFVEMLPTSKPRPGSANPNDPLIPAWPDIRPQNAWCLPQTMFIPHMDRVLNMLGLSVESRTAMITSWLPSVTRHKNIAYRLLSPDQIAPSSTLTITPPPHVLLRIFVLFRGVPDSELKDWNDRGVLHAEIGLDWRTAIEWTPDMHNEELFRVIEYGAMEVFD